MLTMNWTRSRPSLQSLRCTLLLSGFPLDLGVVGPDSSDLIKLRKHAPGVVFDSKPVEWDRLLQSNFDVYRSVTKRLLKDSMDFILKSRCYCFLKEILHIKANFFASVAELFAQHAIISELIFVKHYDQD